MKLEDIKRIDLQARKRYTYKYDEPTRDTWRSHAVEVLANKAWQGDCDDLSSTVCDLLHRAGVPLDHLFFANVDSKGGNRVDHMIAFAKDDQGKIYVVGDTFGVTYPLGDMRHGLLKWCSLANVKRWYAGSKAMV